MGRSCEDRIMMEEYKFDASDGQLAISMNKKLLKASPSFTECCIFKVPSKLQRPGDENVFDPIIVSIGPFHHLKDGLIPTEKIIWRYHSPMEKIKWWYLYCFFERYGLPPEETLELYVQNIGKLSNGARECYAEQIRFNDAQFIEMMILDGCFLIELFRKQARPVERHKDDPIFNLPWMLDRLYHDLILLENQIPWFILQKLFELLSVNEPANCTVPELVLGFFNNMMLMVQQPPPYRSRGDHEIKHILDLLHSCLLSSSEGILSKNTGLQQVPPVTDLLQAGIKFKMGTPSGIFNIKFSNGEFEIPPIIIQSNSEALFRNLIAYEQCNRHCTNQFTSYALFLDCLINTVKDVDVLSRERILQQPALSVENISFLFNRLYNDTLVYNYYYGEVSHKINNHHRSRFRRWIATLKREYFRNPWRISSVVTAILLLIFTGTQTLIAMLAYYNVPPFRKKG